MNSTFVTGYARLSNVEFERTGQEGWTDFYDPRYSISFLDAGSVSEDYPSYVRDCSFHHGFSPAIGVFGTDNLTIENNVIHHTVGAGTFTNILTVYTIAENKETRNHISLLKVNFQYNDGQQQKQLLMAALHTDGSTTLLCP